MAKLVYINDAQHKQTGQELVTIDDLEQFRIKLLTDIRLMLEGHTGKPPKKWLKSHEVRKLLNISASTLHTLRHNGTIPCTRVGGLLFYDATEIDRILGSWKKAS